jgi:hypothetical protein
LQPAAASPASAAVITIAVMVFMVPPSRRMHGAHERRT